MIELNKTVDYHQQKIVMKSWVHSYKEKILKFYFQKLLFLWDLSVLQNITERDKVREGHLV